MTERGLPIVDSGAACPFVAFEDDRDARATSPDHRHRCYAEAEPAPRALAHQEAYCLASAFPVCPTFQDWARREAARATTAGGDRDEPGRATAAATPPAQRNPPRDWTAPPPWAAGSDRDAEGDDDWDDEPEAGVAGAPGARGLAGSYADRMASGAGGPAGGAQGAARGDEMAEGRPGQPLPEPSDSRWDRDDEWDDEDDGRPSRARRRERDALPAAAVGAGTAAARGVRDDARDPRDAGRGDARRAADRGRGAAPEWERPHRFEAYPTLKSRRLGDLSISPLLVGVVALVLAAAILFALPGLFGFGGPQSAATPSPTTIVPSAGPSSGPTTAPVATPQVYIVQAGDTMSRIASKFNVPLGDLIAANRDTITNPDRLQIGDQVIIPAPVPSQLPGTTAAPAAS